MISAAKGLGHDVGAGSDRLIPMKERICRRQGSDVVAGPNGGMEKGMIRRARVPAFGFPGDSRDISSGIGRASLFAVTLLVGNRRAVS